MIALSRLHAKIPLRLHLARSLSDGITGLKRIISASKSTVPVGTQLYNSRTVSPREIPHADSMCRSNNIWVALPQLARGTSCLSSIFKRESCCNNEWLNSVGDSPATENDRGGKELEMDRAGSLPQDLLSDRVLSCRDGVPCLHNGNPDMTFLPSLVHQPT